MAKDNQKKSPTKKNRVAGILCVIVAVWDGIVASGYIRHNPPLAIINTVICILFAALSVYNFIRVRQISTLSNLIESGVSSIDEISISTHLSYDKVVREFNKLVQNGFYNGFYINVADRRIEKGSGIQNRQPIKNITCPNCRATTSDKNGVCEFCGASLK